MLTVKSSPVELRGIVNKTSQKGKVYQVVNTELPDGTPYQVYCFERGALPDGLKRGDKICLIFGLERWTTGDKVFLKKVEKVAV